VACRCSDYPDQIDQQLLTVAANNAATAFQNARLIGELRKAREAVRARERELRKAHDELEIVLCTLPDRSKAYVNSRFVEYAGMPAEQKTGTGWHAAIPPMIFDDITRRPERPALAIGEPLPFREACCESPLIGGAQTFDYFLGSVRGNN